MEIHVLEVQSDRANVVFHIPIPDVLTTAGISYQVALKEYNLDKEIQIPGLDISDATEYAAIENGEIYEHGMTINYDGNLSNAQKKQIIDDEYIAKKNIILSMIQDRLEFWQMAWNTGG